MYNYVTINEPTIQGRQPSHTSIMKSSQTKIVENTHTQSEMFKNQAIAFRKSITIIVFEMIMYVP